MPDAEGRTPSPAKTPSTPPDIWVHPATLAEIKARFMAPKAPLAFLGNVGAWAGSSMFTDCRQVIGTLRNEAMPTGEHVCGPNPCSAARAATNAPSQSSAPARTLVSTPDLEAPDDRD